MIGGYLEEDESVVARIKCASIKNESDLQQALVSDISSILQNMMGIRPRPEIHLVGREITVAHGRIDILVQDSHDGILFPVELKMGKASPAIVEQVERYRRDIRSAFGSILVEKGLEVAPLFMDDIGRTAANLYYHADSYVRPVIVAQNFDQSLYLPDFILIKWSYQHPYLYLRNTSFEIPSRSINPLLAMALNDSLQIVTTKLKNKELIQSTFSEWMRESR